MLNAAFAFGMTFLRGCFTNGPFLHQVNQLVAQSKTRKHPVDRKLRKVISAGAGDRPEDFANLIELPTSPTGPRSFQLLVGGFQLLVGGD